jgi:hypothetical protein
MPTVRVEAHLSSEELLQAVQQLGPDELEQFVSEVLSLRAQRQAPCLSQSETELLLKINQGIPEDVRQRYNTLLAKRDDETLTPEEHAELLGLTEQVERLQAERVKHLVALAQLRQKSLEGVMQDLGLWAPADG